METAQEWIDRGDWEKDLSLKLGCYDKAILVEPMHPLAWERKGFTLAALGRYEEALRAYERACTLAPTESMLWVEKPLLCRLHGRPVLLWAIRKYGLFPGWLALSWWHTAKTCSSKPEWMKNLPFRPIPNWNTPWNG